MRIFHKLLIGFLLISVMIWVVGFFAIHIFQKTRQKTIEGFTVALADRVLEEVSHEVHSNLLRLGARTKGDTLQRTLQASNKAFEEMKGREKYIDQMDREWISAPQDRVTPFMQQILDLPVSISFRQEQNFYLESLGYPVFSEIFVTNRFGVLAGASGKTTDYRQNDENWWKEAWGKGSFQGKPEFDESSKTFSITLASRVKNQLGEPIGVFKGSLDLKDVSSLLKLTENEMLFKSTRLFLLDSTGRYVFPPEKFGEEMEPFLKAQFLGRGENESEKIVSLKAGDGRRHLFNLNVSSKAKDLGTPWSLLVSYDEDEVFEPNKKVENFVFVVAGAATLLSFLIGLFLSMSFSRPLEKLRRAADRFGAGDLSAKIGVFSRDEFGSVARDFELMAESLRNKTTSIENLDREIEERKLLEKISLENALFLQKLMDAIPAPVFYKDVSGVYIGANRAFEKFFGISQKELVGKKVGELFPPEVARIYEERDAELLALPGIQVYETLVKDATGESRNIVFHKATFNGPTGEAQGIIGVIMDITLRKRAEKMTRESESQLKEAQRVAHVGSWTYDLQREQIVFSEEMFRIYGLDPGGAAPTFQETQKMMHPEDWERMTAAIRKSEATGEGYELELRITRKNGDARVIFSRANVQQDANGKAVQLVGISQDITDRKRAEEALRESEKRFMDVLYAAQDAILLIDGDTFVDCNEAAARMLGYPTREEFLMSHPSKLSPDRQPDGRDSFEKANEMMEMAMAQGFHRFEWVHRKASGEDFPVEVSLTPIAIHGKTMLHCLWRDMTELKRIEKAIRESELRYRTLVENLPGVVFRRRNDENSSVEYLSEEILNLTGYPASDFINNQVRTYESVIHPDDREKVADAVHEGALKKEPYVVEYRILSADGSIKWVYEKGKAVFSADGSSAYREGAIFDMTEERSAEQRVRQLSQAVEQSPSCVVITDKAGNIEYVNQRFSELTGYSSGEVLGKNPRILKSGEQPSSLYKDLWATILDGKDWQGQFCNKKKNGELYWEHVHIAPIRDEKGEISHFVAVKEDITYRRQIEEQLRHSLRMEAVGRLAGGIAHDFNNMLTVINGYSGYLMTKMKPEDPHFDKVREIRDAGDCAATVVRQLLNLSRKEAPKPQLIRVADVTQKMERMINRLLGEGIEFKAETRSGAGFVKMDPGQMEQVLLNLLVNAREAMPEGGVLTLTADRVRMEEIQEELMPAKKRTGDFIRVTVKDAGVGIDPAIKSRVFEPFFTTKKRGMNTGLGLSIVCGIVEQAGGAISFESQVGRGTTFRVYLPVAEGVEDLQGGSDAELPKGRGKILLVEDETQVREFALQVLRERGYDVRAVKGGDEALAMLAEDPGRKYDLLLTDLTMPKMNGKELAIQIRKNIPDLKVVFMSGYSEQMVADMKNSGFLQKPFSHGQLSVKVWSVLGR
jgi:PAS domain S-box-containing protein